MNTKRVVSSMGVLAPGFLAIALGACSSNNTPAATGGAAGTGGTATGGGGATGTGGTVPTGTGTGGTGGGTGGAGGGPITDASTPGVAIVFDTGGFVAMVPAGDAGPGNRGIQGAFYAYGDGTGGVGSDGGNCQAAGHSTCSTIAVVFDQVAQTICAMGTAAQVVPNEAGAQDYSGIYGAGVGFDLNNPGGDGGVKSPYDAAANGITGVGFNLRAGDTFGGDFRVEFPATGQDSMGMNLPARYNGVPAGVTTVDSRFSTATVGYAPADTAPVSTNAVISLQWHVATNMNMSIPFNFCLSNIHLLTN